MATGSGPAAPEPAQPGLAGERTALAWIRSTLSWATGAALAVRYGVAEGGGPPAYALAAILASTALAVAAYGHASRRRLRADEPRAIVGGTPQRRPERWTGVARPRWLALLAALTTGCGMLACVVVVLA